METFGLIGNEFINIYSKENPILKEGDICYFLFFNMLDYHRPLIAKGKIMVDKFSNGMSKTYFVRLIEILESPKTINDFVLGKTFKTYGYLGINLINAHKTIQQINRNFDYDRNLFRVEAFFARKDENQIKKFRKEYIEVLKRDVEKQLQDINEVLNS